MAAREIVIAVDEEAGRQQGHQEKGVEIPFARLDPETLRNLISEFVSREWEEWGDSDCTLDEKIAQVLAQLAAKKARVVYDLETESANIVVNR